MGGGGESGLRACRQRVGLDESMRLGRVPCGGVSISGALYEAGMRQDHPPLDAEAKRNEPARAG